MAHDKEYATLVQAGHVEQFKRSLLGLLDHSAPPVDRVKLTSKPDPRSRPFADYQDNNPDYQRSDLIEIKENDVEGLRDAHATFVSGMDDVHIPFVAGRRGIVTTADGDLLPVFIVSLRMLRRTGSTLPVELWMQPQETEDEYLCQELLPSLNARCMYIDRMLLGGPGEAEELAKYRFKIFAILLSTFEEVLFIDADNFPARSPDTLFTSEPYLSSGFVTWPDYWLSSASRHLFAIQGVDEVPPVNKMTTTEAGQMVISKRSHARTLLLSAYYNYYGPLHYYILITQGGHGEGDKDTFILAANCLNQTFYQVARPLDTLGAKDDEGHNHDNAMLQFDPIDEVTFSARNVRPLFVHVHRGKANPNKLMEVGGKSFGGEHFAFDPQTGQSRRMLGPLSLMIDLFGEDLEQIMWREIRTMACDMGDALKYWKAVPSTVMTQGACDRVQAYMDTVFGQTHNATTHAA